MATHKVLTFSIHESVLPKNDSPKFLLLCLTYLCTQVQNSTGASFQKNLKSEELKHGKGNGYKMISKVLLISSLSPETSPTGHYKIRCNLRPLHLRLPSIL